MPPSARSAPKLSRAGASRAPAEGAQTFAARLQEKHTLAGPSIRQAQALLAQYVGLQYALRYLKMTASRHFARAVRRFRADPFRDSDAKPESILIACKFTLLPCSTA